MRFVKPVAGMLMILAAAGGLIFWEIQGRQMVMQESVLVTVQPIHQGEKIEKEMFAISGVEHDSVMDGALKQGSLASLEGRYANQYIANNAQIAGEYFISENYDLAQGESVFALKSGWIDGRSSSVRKGDIIEIYDDRGELLLGTFKVAFVKDSSDNEITCMEGLRDSSRILDRTRSTGYISNIEIITTVENYGKLARFVESSGRGLLIVQKFV